MLYTGASKGGRMVPSNRKGNLMTLIDIYSDFKSLTSNKDKCEYLRNLQLLNLPYDINYENLIKYYTK
jgi:hypothetical protein